MQPTSHAFKENATRALDNAQLQRALGNMKQGFIVKRQKAVDRLPEFDQLRDHAKEIKDHTLEHLDFYLETFEERVTAQGGQVHWAPTAADARQHVLDICRRRGAKTVTKGKSMVAEEIGLNDFLESHEIVPVETDLGEYIIQLRGEPPSHIIAPAVHLNRDQVEADFRKYHLQFPPDRALSEARQLVNEARAVLRQRYLDADLGITGANFLVAETGASVIVTNEGNGDLTQALPRVHVVIASLEKIVPTLEDATTIMRVLARSATGQEQTVYTTFSAGPKRTGDLDGPEEFHVILLDNGRSAMLGTEFQDMLRCIRCGACMNHCPVYHAVGGHAYGWTYPGPMGAVLTPSLIGVNEAGHLPNASTFCGRCQSVCPMHIPLPKMMRHWREREYERHLQPLPARTGLKLWAGLARRPTLYQLATRLQAKTLHLIGRKKGRFGWLPLAGGWTRHRDFPTPEGKTFQQLWAERQRAQAKDQPVAKGRPSA
ncbi:LutB/LldF family L-lactate oxidation iron-sulfur protein [Rhodovibrio salinarum]|uniref:Iron-sulfur cluster-binding protein n=1 Tax=Rhodovibrio salinarum TaxID=1087 RepID=A0A934QHN0_9PROT|nr:LutB/LldF family L-lactate oxidation iron-sulfur protein [Rhodovibrio salinarum]MBK1696872.1 iron-sulfur cluster-binding protein [Rhodovibrio salinarum]